MKTVSALSTMMLCLSFPLFACTASEPTTSASPVPSVTSSPATGETTSPVPSASAETSPQPSATTSLNPSPTNNPANLQVSTRTLVGGLDTPWELAELPDGRLLVSERGGQIRLIRNGQLEATSWFDATTLSDPVAELGEGGMLGLAIAPDFTSSGQVYLAYTAMASGQRVNRLVLLRESTPGQVQFVRVISESPAAANHNGGRIAFGPDGKLYWATGENYVNEMAQDLNSQGGKILRLNPDGSRPTDNPFANSLVWSYGHRNPQGLAWDNQNNFYSTEHGPSGGQGCCQDELNLIRSGQNYGWPQITGDTQREGMVSPIRHSGNSVTWAPGGLAWIKQGPWQGSLLIPGLRGAALYRAVPGAQPDQIQTFETHLSGQLGRIRTVVQLSDGRIMLLTSNRDGRGSAVTPEDDRVVELLLN